MLVFPSSVAPCPLQTPPPPSPILPAIPAAWTHGNDRAAPKCKAVGETRGPGYPGRPLSYRGWRTASGTVIWGRNSCKSMTYRWRAPWHTGGAGYRCLLHHFISKEPASPGHTVLLGRKVWHPRCTPSLAQPSGIQEPWGTAHSQSGSSRSPSHGWRTNCTQTTGVAPSALAFLALRIEHVAKE